VRSAQRATGGGELGQGSVEVVAMLPLVALVAAAILQLLAAGLASELADHAAEAGAVAILQEREPREAVRDALPGWSRERVDVAIRGRKVEVRLRPLALTASLADLLSAEAAADAGRAT
jgi:hypothetical protein